MACCVKVVVKVIMRLLHIVSKWLPNPLWSCDPLCQTGCKGRVCFAKVMTCVVVHFNFILLNTQLIINLNIIMHRLIHKLLIGTLKLTGRSPIGPGCPCWSSRIPTCYSWNVTEEKDHSDLSDSSTAVSTTSWPGKLYQISYLIFLWLHFIYSSLFLRCIVPFHIETYRRWIWHVLLFLFFIAFVPLYNV